MFLTAFELNCYGVTWESLPGTSCLRPLRPSQIRSVSYVEWRSEGIMSHLYLETNIILLSIIKEAAGEKI